MKVAFVWAACLAACLSSVAGLSVKASSRQMGGTNPVASVLSLLDELSAKIAKEGEVEAKAYAEFVEWCDDAAKNKQFEIKTAQAKKEKLEAHIAKMTDDSSAAAAKIEELASAVSSGDGDLKSATEIRTKEAEDYAANEKELMDVIDKLGRAVAHIDREMSKNPAAFPQVDDSSAEGVLKTLTALTDAASFSNADQQRLSALVQSQASGSDADELGAPDPAVYKSQSGNILDVLEDLKEKAEEQLSALRKAEANAKHNYNMLKQSLEDQMAADKKDLDEEKANKAGAEEAKAAASGDLEGTVADLADGKKTLETASGGCMTTAADHEATVAGRKVELATIAKARQILTDTSTGAVAQTYSFLQSASNSRSTLRTSVDLANAEIVTMVKKLAKEQHSTALAQLASRVAAMFRYGASAGEDPFKKVKGLISDMVTKLEAEMSSEATEKAYCDEQMAETDAKRGELTGDEAKLTAKIDKAASASAGLKEDVKELQSELAAISKAQAEMDKIRAESKDAYTQAKADLSQGLEGIRKALGVLREYYANEGDAAALVQEGVSAGDGQPAPPVKHSAATGAGTSIIGILEVAESDFAQNLAKEETEEADAESSYEKTTQENKVTTALKNQDVKYKTQEFKGLDQDLAELSSDRESTSSELAAVMEYFAKIKDRCIAKPETYEERKRRREAEIAGLHDALEVLENETAFMQKGKRGKKGKFLAPLSAHVF